MCFPGWLMFAIVFLRDKGIVASRPLKRKIKGQYFIQTGFRYLHLKTGNIRNQLKDLKSVHCFVFPLVFFLTDHVWILSYFFFLLFTLTSQGLKSCKWAVKLIWNVYILTVFLAGKLKNDCVWVLQHLSGKYHIQFFFCYWFPSYICGRKICVFFFLLSKSPHMQ